MHSSIKQFFLKDSVLMGSVLCAIVLWAVNAVLNLRNDSYTSFFINLLYIICLMTLAGADLKNEENVKQGMIGALMATFIMGNVNILSPALKNMAVEGVPSRAFWQLIVSFVLALGLFINHFMLSHSKYINRKRIALNQIILLLILLLRCFQLIINFTGGNYSTDMIR